MFQIILQRKSKHAFYFQSLFFRKSFHSWGNLKIIQPDRPQMTVWGTRIACWITKATNTHSKYVILIAFYCNNGCTNAPRCYVTRTRTLPVLFQHILERHCGPRQCPFPDVNQSELDADHLHLLELYVYLRYMPSWWGQGQIYIFAFTFSNDCFFLKFCQSVDFISGLHSRRPSSSSFCRAPGS